MSAFGFRILSPWHRFLGLSRQTPESWHLQRLTEERQECQGATSFVGRLSETSDVFFTISRARHDGYEIDRQPTLWKPYHVLVYAYMFSKFTSRWALYRTAAYFCKVPNHHTVREVVNPVKDEKLEVVAGCHNIDVVQFKRVAKRLRRVWPLPP